MSYICCKCGLLAPTVRFLIVEVFVDVSNVTSTCSKLRCHTPVPRAYTASPSGLPIGTSYYTTQHNTTQHNTTQASSRIRDTLGSNIADTQCVRHARVCRMHSYEVVPRRCLPEAAKSKEAVVTRGDEERTHEVGEVLGVTMLRCASRCGANQNSYLPCNNQRGAMQSEPALRVVEGDGRHCAACQCWSCWPGSQEAGQRWRSHRAHELGMLPEEEHVVD